MYILNGENMSSKWTSFSGVSSSNRPSQSEVGEEKSLEHTNSIEKLLSVLVLGAIVFFAAVPSWLVVRDRWLGDQAIALRYRAAWCRVGFLCQTALPAYFAFIFACFFGLLMLMLVQEKWPQAVLSSSFEPTSQPAARIGLTQRRISSVALLIATAGFAGVFLNGVIRHVVPGWDLVAVLLAFVFGRLLREWPIEDMANAWRRNVGPVVAVLLAQIALVVFLARTFSVTGFSWVVTFALLLAVVNLLRYYRRVSPIVWIVSLALVLYTFNINAWWFSVVGDEFTFFTVAREIAEKQSLSFIGSQLFIGQTVYGAHPYFSSLLQAIPMKLFGSHNLGWHLSSLYLSAVAVGLFYLFFKTFVSGRVALIAAFFLAVSHYIMAFGKIGYNNLQALFAMSLALCVAAWAMRTKRSIAFVMLGLACGLCFYVYPAALYALPVVGLLLLFYFPPASRLALRRWSVLAMSLFMLVFPLFLQPGYWQAKVAGTLLYNPQVVRSTSTIIAHFATNLAYSFFSFVYVPEESHFVTVSYLDPLTAVFAFIGIACLLRWGWRERFTKFLLVGFAVLLFLVGASHDRTFPPTTRMFLLLPWFALIAAFGLTWLVERGKQVGLSRLPLAGLVAPVLVTVIGLNVYQAYTLSWQRMTGLQNVESLFLRLAMHVQDVVAEPPKTFIIVTDSQWGIGGLQMLQQVYSIPPSPEQLKQVTVAGPSFSEADRSIIADRNALVIIQPRMDTLWRELLESSLEKLDKVPCGIKTTNGTLRFTLWHSPELARVCE
jgi:4-amino-4-deoxy-L-arabinose transferase-like glycosyltransferase